MFEYQLWLYYLNCPTDNWVMVEFCSSREQASKILARYKNDPLLWQSITQYRIVKMEMVS